MKKILDRLTALVMVILMVIQTITPAITSFAKEEELDKRYVIQKLDTLKQDTYVNFSLNLATVIDDKNLDSDTNVKFVLNATDTNSNIKLLVRKDFSLYDERIFDTVEEAHKEFDRVDKSLKDQGLSLDVSVVQEGDKYRIHNNYVPQADKENFGDDYKVYSLKVVPEFDFDKEGLYNKLPENLKSTERHRLQLAEERRLQQDGEVPEGDKHNRTYIFDFKVDKAVDSKLTTIALNKDENNPLEVNQNADLFAAILDDKTYSIYQTEKLPAEVVSSVEHKKQVEQIRQEEQAKKEAEAKAKKEAEEKAKADADKIKAEQDKKAQEQKTAEEKAKQEADAKAKAEAYAKAKAEAEKIAAAEKAKAEQLEKAQKEAEAKKQAEEKAKQDSENKKFLGLEPQDEQTEEEHIIKKKETKQEVKSEPATPEERKQKAKEFDQALKDKKEEIKKDQVKQGANNKEGNKGLLEGIKEFFGLTNLQKADRELKAILSTQANGLKEVQALLTSFETKYNLTKEEQAKLMDDNADAIKALIEKDADKNFRPQVFADTGAKTLNLDGKKFNIMTRFDTSTSVGPIKKDQYFRIHLDDKLTVKSTTTLEPIKYNNEVIATPKYNSADNTITYTITRDITENIQVPLNIPVDYNTTNIKLDDNGEFVVVNRVSGLGVEAQKDLLPQKIDKNGNPAGSIIEPGRDDVIKIVDDKNGNYQVPIDISGHPVIENGEMVGINWNMRVHADQSLSTLGFTANFTTVEGAGLGEIQSVLANGKDAKATDQLDKALGIVDSKHHEVTENIQDISYSFYTPVTNKQEKYMIDVSVFLKSKEKTGAVRFILDQGWPKEKVEEATPTRVGINNRTTIQGKFLANDKAEWTITDAISSGDEGNNGMPLENRTLSGDQSVTSGKSAVYGLDTDKNSQTYGQMVVKKAEHTTNNSLPSKGTNPIGNQAVGNIAVYKVTTDLNNPATYQDYEVSGVKISKYRDLYVQQVWNLPEGLTMPSEIFKAVGNDGAVLGEVSVGEGQLGEKERIITIPNVEYWNIDSSGNANLIDYRIKQEYDENPLVIDGRTYRYYENVNYYKNYEKVHYIHNSAIDETQAKTASFKIVKVDSKDPSKKIKGATFRLLGTGIDVTTNENGEAVFTDIPSGSYQLKETRAADGYKIDQDLKTVNISSDGKISV
ncbi:MAG: SpaA isopeptide-forming pilin-related protein, partial [Finegoldia magna]|nr:SpaA isopeptide-forming pilin-related protein [Finegoldia magna]